MFAAIKSLMRGVLSFQQSVRALKGFTYSNQAVEFIKLHEKFIPVAYKDATGTWTIGWGSTYYADGTPVKRGDVITRSRAEVLMRHVMDDMVEKIDEYVHKDLNQCQIDALVSFCYNVGTDAFRKSTLCRKINANPQDPKIAGEFARWIRSKGKTLPGLIRRRKEESELYFNPCN